MEEMKKGGLTDGAGSEANGEWKTINGAHIFIEDGQSIEDAMAEKFDKSKPEAKKTEQPKDQYGRTKEQVEQHKNNLKSKLEEHLDDLRVQDNAIARQQEVVKSSSSPEAKSKAEKVLSQYQRERKGIEQNIKAIQERINSQNTDFAITKNGLKVGQTFKNPSGGSYKILEVQEGEDMGVYMSINGKGKMHFSKKMINEKIANGELTEAGNSSHSFSIGASVRDKGDGTKGKIIKTGYNQEGGFEYATVEWENTNGNKLSQFSIPVSQLELD